MEADFWHEKWQQQQIGFHQQEVNALLQQHWHRLGLEPESQVFVPLCGKSLDMCFLAELGHRILGCELSLTAVEQFFADNRLEVCQSQEGEHRRFDTEQLSIYQGDIFSLPLEVTEGVTGFYDRAALIAWPESMRLAYVKQLAKLLPGGSKGLLVTLDYPQASLSGPPFAVSPDWVTTHMAADFEIRPLVSQDVLADNPRFVKKQVPWLTEAAYLLERK
ncbi:thiopurine S-methyltransferase [Shewanella sp. AS16]|uniref:thiopurine S-methyltransferase n=1 Tax=Shewanella sp. AS16 TaxID=2907625 RepID=UPI001F1EEE80|nr:thiopurine S-methyltransferase [Shewanella sp. AS16]MCE9685840.1 thiopurine S-methyltransferase [Shewanella sp. AS16]